MSMQLSKKDDTGKLLHEFTIEAWPKGTADTEENAEKFVRAAAKCWSWIAIARAIMSLKIEARAKAVSLINGTVNRPAMTVPEMQEEMLHWTPSGSAMRRGLTKAQKAVRDLRKAGYSDAQIKAFLTTVDEAE